MDFACIELFESTIELLCEIELSLAKELKLSKGHLSYVDDLYTKLKMLQ